MPPPLSVASVLDGTVTRLDAATREHQVFALPDPRSSPIFISRGSDGAIWFTELAADKVGQIPVLAEG